MCWKTKPPKFGMKLNQITRKGRGDYESHQIWPPKSHVFKMAMARPHFNKTVYLSMYRYVNLYTLFYTHTYVYVSCMYVYVHKCTCSYFELPLNKQWISQFVTICTLTISFTHMFVYPNSIDNSSEQLLARMQRLNNMTLYRIPDPRQSFSRCLVHMCVLAMILFEVSILDVLQGYMSLVQHICKMISPVSLLFCFLSY